MNSCHLIVLTGTNSRKTQEKTPFLKYVVRVECYHCVAGTYNKLLRSLATIFTNCHVVFIRDLQVIVTASQIACFKSSVPFQIKRNPYVYIYIYIYIYRNFVSIFPKYSARYVKVERHIYFENRKKLHFHPDNPEE